MTRIHWQNSVECEQHFDVNAYMVDSHEDNPEARPAYSGPGLCIPNRKEHDDAALSHPGSQENHQGDRPRYHRLRQAHRPTPAPGVGPGWASHGARVAHDAAYAAVTATVLGGFLGLVPIKDVLAAVLSTVLGVYMTSSPGYSRDVDRWTDSWDLS
jgi:hypothetical protein